MSDFPIKDPDLAELSELLHRMEICQTREPFQWMAGTAIRRLRAYARRIEQAKRCVGAADK